MSAPLIFIAGARGTGKSTLGRDLSKVKRRIVLDPSGDWGRKFPRGIVRNLQDVSDVYSRNWHRGFDIIYTPPVGHEAYELHRLSILVFAYQEKLVRRVRAGDVVEQDYVTVVVEEMAESYSNADGQSQSSSGFRRVILQGRHQGISVIGISQRPQDVAARFRDNAERYFVFMQDSDTGREAVLNAIGRANRAKFEALRDFEYLEKRRGGQVSGPHRTKR